VLELVTELPSIKSELIKKVLVLGVLVTPFALAAELIVLLQLLSNKTLIKKKKTGFFPNQYLFG
jgi:hypothetical protein